MVDLHANFHHYASSSDLVVHHEDAIDALLSLTKVLLSVTLLQALGYVMKATGAFPASAESGVGAFIGGVCLPAIIFRAIAAIDFTRLDASILVAVVVAKLCMVAASYVLGQVARRGRVRSPGERNLRGGTFAVLTTNGDELGLGLPVLGVLYPPEKVRLCFLLNGMQMLVLNVLAFVMLGVGAERRDAAKAHETAGSMRTIVAAAIGGLRHNRLVQSLALAVVYNLVLGHGRGAQLPFFADDVVTMLSGAFAPGVFFLQGTSSVGAYSQLGSLSSAVLPLTLVLLKSLILPTLIKVLVGALGGDESAQDFGMHERDFKPAFCTCGTPTQPFTNRVSERPATLTEPHGSSLAGEQASPLACSPRRARPSSL